MFGWIKPSAGLANVKLQRRDRVDAAFTMAQGGRRVKGKWRIDEMPDYEADFPYMVEPAYILVDGEGSGRFAFGYVTGAIHGAGNAYASRSVGPATTKWMKPEATDGASTRRRAQGAMKPTSSPNLLLQQPVSCAHAPSRNKLLLDGSGAGFRSNMRLSPAYAYILSVSANSWSPTSLECARRRNPLGLVNQRDGFPRSQIGKFV